MKQSLAHGFIIVSLILSLICFILSLIAFCLPNWKHVQLRSTPMITSEDNQLDPLIRGELEKYTDILYQRGEVHAFGLFGHCVGSSCGRNLLPSFHENNYETCHHIKYYSQCIFSNTSLIKCTCQKPSYISTTYTLFILILIFEILFLIVNLLRLYRRRRYCLNDIQLRLISIISTLFSSVFLIIIITQHNKNRLYEPLEFFQSMHRHYSRRQIYAFSNNLELILKQIEQDLEIHFGASYICVIFILILTLISFFTSSTVEIKIFPTSDEDERKDGKQNQTLIQPPRIERFVPSEQIHFMRQTKV